MLAVPSKARRVGPAFQRMRQRQMPSAARRGFVAIKRRDARVNGTAPMASAKREIARARHRRDWRR